MSHFADVENDPQAWINGYVKKITFPNGETGTMPCPPIHMASLEDEDYVVAPSIGAHTSFVLQDYGYTDEEIHSLMDSGAVK